MDDENCKPNLLAQWLKPENRVQNTQVADYLPNCGYVLYENADSIEGEFIEYMQTYKLLDLNNNTILWQYSEAGTPPFDINNVHLTSKGNYIIISRWDKIDVIEVKTGKQRTISIPDAGHYTNIAYTSHDEKHLYQTFELGEYAHIYDMSNMECIDSISTFPLCPNSFSFLNDTRHIINYFDWITTERKSYMYIVPAKVDNTAFDIFYSLIKEDRNKLFCKDEEDALLIYNDKKGTKWTSPNANFVGFTPDNQYVVIDLLGFRGVEEYQVVEINSGLCMHKEDHEFDEKKQHIYFSSYNELIKTCKSLVKNYELAPSAKKEFYLQK